VHAALARAEQRIVLAHARAQTAAAQRARQAIGRLGAFGARRLDELGQSLVGTLGPCRRRSGEHHREAQHHGQETMHHDAA
jgi:hypothetical protein